jgi:hypothetical protein
MLKARDVWLEFQTGVITSTKHTPTNGDMDTQHNGDLIGVSNWSNYIPRDPGIPRVV